MDEPALLQAQGLGVVRDDRAVLDDVSFRANRGEVLGILGPNGAGKSTLLKALAGLLPHNGQVLIDGRPDDALDRRERARRIAYVPQHSALNAALPVTDVVAQGRFAHAGPLGRPTARDERAIQRAMERTGADRFVGRSFDRLSYGERRLVLLARALATEAPVLLLDEPTAALDVRHALTLLETLRALARQGQAVLVVLHQLQEAADSCDRVLLLAEGRAVAHGPAGQILTAAPVKEVWQVDLVPHAHFGFRLPDGEGTS
jgi:iron complex transport system ATP-binding protein